MRKPRNKETGEIEYGRQQLLSRILEIKLESQFVEYVIVNLVWQEQSNVSDSGPTCEFNFSSEGVITKNTCEQQIKEESIRVSCYVTHSPNVRPELIVTECESTQSFSSGNTYEAISGRTSAVAVIKPSLEFTPRCYMCRIKQSDFVCYTKPVKLLCEYVMGRYCFINSLTPFTRSESTCLNLATVGNLSPIGVMRSLSIPAYDTILIIL